MGTSISQIITVTTPPLGVAPGPATGLSISNIAPTTLTLSWTAPSSGTTPFTYQPQFAPAGSSPTWTNIGGTISATTVAVTSLTANTAYQFQVLASNTSGTSTSVAVSATTLSVAPGAPSGLALVGTPTQTTVQLQWNAPSVGTQPFTYQVLFRSPTGSGSFAAIGATIQSLTSTVSGLTAATSYDFEVVASNLAGSGVASAAVVNVQTAGATGAGPGPATGLTITNLATTTLTLSWTAPTTGTAPFTYQPQIAPAGSSPTWSNIGGSISATTVAATALSANTAYQFQVVTSNSVSSSISATVSTTTLSVLPGAPTGLLVSGSPTQTTVSLQWTAPAVGSSPFTYQVAMRTPTGSGSFNSAGATTTGVSQTITGLTASTSYDFEVSATNLAGTGPQSSVLVNVVTAAVVVGTAPGPATGLTVSSLATTTLTLSWTAPSSGTTPFTYQPQVSLAGSSPAWSNIGSSISATTVAVTGLTANTGYQFQVITNNGVGSSTSATVSTTTLSVLPSAPTALIVFGTPTQTTISLQWTAPTTGTTPFTYQVAMRTPTGSGSFVSAGSSTASLFQTISGLTPGTSYDFEVSATNLAGTGPQSSVLVNVSTAAGSVVVGPATGLTISSLGTTTLTLSWTAPSVGTLPFTYQPQIAPAGGSPTWTNIGGSISATTVAVTALTANTGYQFQVITTNVAGSSTSASVSTTTLSVLPGAPTSVAVVGSPTQTTVALQWVAPAAGTTPFTYQVSMRSPTGSGSFTAAGAATSGLTQTISGLTASTSYDFEVSAANLAGTGPQSSILLDVITAAVVVGTAPGPATGLAISSLTATTLTLSWSAPSTGTTPFTYQPQQALAGSSPAWSNIGSSISATTVAVTGLTANTGYQFQVVTSNGVGSSTSATVSATTSAVLPGAPTALAVSGSPTQTTITLVWAAPVTGTAPLTYQVSSRTPSGSGAFASAGATTTSLTQTISGLVAGTAYDFEVSAANVAGTGPQSSVLANVSTAAASGVAPSAPTNLAAGTITQNTIPLTWTAPAVGTPPLSYTVLYRLH